jgi:hexosaminidase
MQRILSAMLLLVITFGCTPKKEVNAPNIVPLPVYLRLGIDHFTLPKDITLGSDGNDAQLATTLLSNYLIERQYNVTNNPSSTKTIQLSIVDNAKLGKEGYDLVVNKEGVALKANTGAGLFYGIQTLTQSIEADGTIPYLSITDYPRLEYRGLHLDVSRHMFPVEFIKKYIDLLAKHKMNRFHWHLTDDQGWRIEIKRYPKLQEIAAYRNETIIGHAITANRDVNRDYDGKRYGGYYTQDEIKEVVAYAAERYVTVIPEIEMPGHAQAALSAYPELGCTGGPYTAATTWGVFDEVFCAGKEETFQFLEHVIDEVVALFPSEYIHVGGDECPKTRWEKCPHCKKRMKDENLKDAHHLQSYFVQRMEKYINSKGKKIIGWDEILEGGLAPNATVMSWRGEEGGIESAQQGHDVIMTPTAWCYLDYYQGNPEHEPLAIGGFVPIKKVYSYNPVPTALTPEQAKHIIGFQGNLWTEYVTTPEHVEYMVYPRAIAIAEVGWTPQESRDYADFILRMEKHLKRLDEWNVHYAKVILDQIDSVRQIQTQK